VAVVSRTAPVELKHQQIIKTFPFSVFAKSLTTFCCNLL
jgi:hypothetical protein